MSTDPTTNDSLTPRKRPGPPDGARARNRAARVAAIERATRELALNAGVAGTTIAEICAEAGIAKGSFYRYFESKAAVLEVLLAPLSAALDEGGSIAVAMMHKARDGASVSEAYAALAAAIAPTLFQHSESVQLYLSECRAPAHTDRAPIHALRDRVGRLATQLAVAAHATGQLRAVDPRVSALVVIGAVERLALALFEDADLPEPAVVISQLMEIVLDGVLVDG